MTLEQIVSLIEVERALIAAGIHIGFGRLGDGTLKAYPSPTVEAASSDVEQPLVEKWRAKVRNLLECCTNERSPVISARLRENAAAHESDADELEALMKTLPEKIHSVFHDFSGKPCREDDGWCDARDHADAVVALINGKPMANPDKPRDRPSVPDVLPRVREIYERHTAGCCLHILTDDGNVSNEDAQFCLETAIERKHTDCEHVARMLVQMTVIQRRKVYRLRWR